MLRRTEETPKTTRVDKAPPKAREAAKASDDPVTLKDLCAEAKIDPYDARVKLRAAKEGCQGVSRTRQAQAGQTVGVGEGVARYHRGAHGAERLTSVRPLCEKKLRRPPLRAAVSVRHFPFTPLPVVGTGG
jgi:hypothetical protein